MRLVVDTNVLISAALTQASWPANTVRWIGRYGGLLKSEATEQELFVVLERPRVATKGSRGNNCSTHAPKRKTATRNLPCG
jgi:predicted nucleic acid-binding protein